MNVIENVTDVTGNRNHKTLKGETLSPVFYEAVQEYHDILVDADYEGLLNFAVSEKTTNATVAKIRELVVALNNGVMPDSLAILPKDLYISLGRDWFENILLTTSPPPAGSQSREDYDVSLTRFQTTITGIISSAYHLPSNTKSYDVYNIKSIIELSGKDTEKAETQVQSLSKVNKAVIASTIAGASFSPSVITFLMGMPALGPLVLAAIFGTLGVVFGGLITLDTDLQLSKKKRVKGVFGLGKKQFRTVKEDFKELIKPYLASMESFLLQENGNVDLLEAGNEVFVVKEKLVG